MKKLSLEIKLQSPVCIAKKRGVGNMIECLDYIPASSIRGALASFFLDAHPTIDSTFHDLFTTNKVHWGNAYVKNAAPIPLTAMSCKYEPGFLTKQSKSAHGVTDILLPNARNYIRTDETEVPTSCHCGAPLDRFSGFVAAGKDTILQKKPAKRILTKTAISDISETAAESSLYSIEVLDEKKRTGNSFQSQMFTAVLHAEDSMQEQLEALIEKANGNIRLGIGRSRGFGEIELQLYEYLPPPVPPLKERVETFNRNLAAPGFGFSVTLLSDTILLDNYLRFTTSLEPYILGREAIQQGTFFPFLNQFHFVSAWAQRTTVFGWNSAVQMPKDEQVAIAKGSVFLFYAEYEPSPEDKDSFYKFCKMLEQAGIGERKTEGFGRISVCDAFHQEEKK